MPFLPLSAPKSLRSRLLWGILPPVMLLIAFNAYYLYEQAFDSATIAYDRTLLASAKSISEQLNVVGYDEQAQISASVVYSALEAFEADNQSSIYYRVSDAHGHFVSGYENLPEWHGKIAQKPRYAALVDFYDAQYQGEAVRMAVLLQPVVSGTGRGMATIQVAETLGLRRTMAREILINTMLRQAGLLALIAILVTIAVQIATRPVRKLSTLILQRQPLDYQSIHAPDLPTELKPVLDATNAVMAQLQNLANHQKRFIRDTAHQIRTPLAVLKTQLQSAMRESDASHSRTLDELLVTVEEASALANQMLALAKVEQLRLEPAHSVLDWAQIVREISIALSPLIVDKDLDFSITTQPCPILAHDWMLRELSRNILYNAIHHGIAGQALNIALRVQGERAELTVTNSSAQGISPGLRERIFHPFTIGDADTAGSGIGLAICENIVRALHGEIDIYNLAPQNATASQANFISVQVRCSVRIAENMP